MMRTRMMILFSLLGSVALTGCSKTSEHTNTSQKEDVSSAQTITLNEIDTSELFSDRDLDGTYDVTSCISVQLADGASTCTSDAVEISEDTITITEEGTYLLSGELTDGMVIVEAEDTDKIQLILDAVSISNSQSAALYVRSADKVFVTLAEGKENTLENGGTYTAIDDNNIDAAVFSKSDLTFQGSGQLTVTAKAGHGIVSKDDLVFTGGTYTINGADHGISGKDSVCIADGTYEIVSGKDGIHAENADDAEKGFVYLVNGTFDIAAQQDGISAEYWLLAEDGTYTVAAKDDGIHGDSSVFLTGGNMDITESYEGIEGFTIDITGGEISVTASDDGLNAAGGSDSSESDAGGEKFDASTAGAYISIAGGNLYVDASGDGIDSNGDLLVSGGETYLSGPTNGGNGSLDYGGTATISGGTFVAAGSSGMAQNFGADSTQGAMLVTFDSQNAQTDISLTDSSGNTLVSWTAEKTYSFVIISCPKIEQGETYTLTAGTATEQIEMEDLIYGAGSQIGGGPSGNGEPSGEQMPGKGGKPEGGQRPDQGEIPSGESRPSMGDAANSAV